MVSGVFTHLFHAGTPSNAGAGPEDSRPRPRVSAGQTPASTVPSASRAERRML